MEAHKPTLVGSRRGRQPLPVQTTLTPPPHRTMSTHSPKSPQNRPPPPRPEEVSVTPSGEKIPLRTPKSQSSRSSLRNLFLRSKSSRSSIPSSDTSLPSIAESQKLSVPVPLPSPRSTLALSPTPSTCPTPTSMISSRDYPPRPLTKAASSASLRTPRSGRNTASPSPTAYHPPWQPPPLFKAYPQALQHATLLTPNISPETIVRIDSHQRIMGEKTTGLYTDPEEGNGPKRKGQKIRKHVRRISQALNKVEWKRKIYMLVTSGYVLQYSDDGNFDRRPEKIMELGKNSVAFASDAIPGKHWVLQISQIMDSKNSLAFDTRRSFLSRLGLPEARKVTKTMLLVFENPEELASWLTLVRREIDSLGGRAFVPDGGSPTQESKPDLYRFKTLYVQREATKFDPPRSPLLVVKTPTEPDTPSKGFDKIPGSDMSQKSGPESGDIVSKSSKQANRRSLARRSRSIDAPSLSTLGTFTDLDRLRDSYISTETRTVSGSSSPILSPAVPVKPPTLSAADADAARIKVSSGRSHKGGAAASVELKSKPDTASRAHPCTQEEKRPEKSSRAAAVVSPRPPSRNTAVNFSVPTFSKRFTISMDPSRPSSSSSSSKGRSMSRAQCITPEPSKTGSLRSATSFDTPSTPRGSLQTARPRSSASTLRKTHNTSEGSSTSASLASCSEISETSETSEETIAAKAAKDSSLNRRHSSYGDSIRWPLLSSEAISEMPDLPPNLDRRKSTIRSKDTTSKQEDTQIKPTSPKPSIRPRPYSMHFAASKTLSEQRSMPLLNLRDPPAPPPDCPLPEIPPYKPSRRSIAIESPIIGTSAFSRQANPRFRNSMGHWDPTRDLSKDSPEMPALPADFPKPPKAVDKAPKQDRTIKAF